MGLDMYLIGVRHYDNNCRPKRDSHEVKAEILDLGYWRKHPNLHGFIVQNFADGVDQCQEINLSGDNIRDILNSNDADELPTTTGFFFGTSQPEDKAETKRIFEGALEWLKTEEEGILWKDVVYRASW